MATQYLDVVNSFHSTFADKTEIPDVLEALWFKKSLAQYGVEIQPIEYDWLLGEFNDDIDQYVVDTLALMMKVMYLERYYSKVNKIASIVGKDLSVNGQGNLSKYAEDELSKTYAELNTRLSKLKPTAYS